MRITDLSTLVGIGITAALIITAINQGNSDPRGFIDTPSLLIVLLGTLFLVAASFSFSDVWRSKGLILRTIFYQADDPQNAAEYALEVAEMARKRGILDLQKNGEMMGSNRFFQHGMSMIIDGLQPEEAENMLKTEIASTAERHKTSTLILRKASEIAPAMGLVGTLIGLVQMLANLDDPSTIGPAMAVALLTTFYGAIMAYVVFIPLATKLERNSRAELIIMKIYLEAVSSIGKKENPRRLEMMINTLLPPAKRVNYFS